MEMCCWMGMHFHNWIDYHGVTFSIVLPEWQNLTEPFSPDTRTQKTEVTDKESVIYKHLQMCEHLAFIHNLFSLTDTLNNITTPPISGNNEYAINVVQNHTMVLDYDDNPV